MIFLSSTCAYLLSFNIIVTNLNHTGTLRSSSRHVLGPQTLLGHVTVRKILSELKLEGEVAFFDVEVGQGQLLETRTDSAALAVTS